MQAAVHPLRSLKMETFYYCGGQNGNMNPGGLTLVRETPQRQQTIFNAHLEDTLNRLDDGITGMAASPDGSLYLACWNSLIRVTMDGKVTSLLHPVTVSGCDEDPADHREINRGKPLLRGLAVDSGGTVYTAATSCHCLIKITPDGKVKTILKSQCPWSPTGVAIHNGDIYILEYTNANGPATERWIPRVRKIERSGKITTLADFSKTYTVATINSFHHIWPLFTPQMINLHLVPIPICYNITEGSGRVCLHPA